jgi:hypothetical protein
LAGVSFEQFFPDGGRAEDRDTIASLSQLS